MLLKTVLRILNYPKRPFSSVYQSSLAKLKNEVPINLRKRMARMISVDEALLFAEKQQVGLLNDESCIVVDEHDGVITGMSKKECHLMENINKGLLHRAFSVFLFNEDNKLLLQQRSSDKITFPLFWTNTCCSHPRYDYSEIDHRVDADLPKGIVKAAQRRLNDELGLHPISCLDSQFTYLTRIHYKSSSDTYWGEHEIDYILFLKSIDPCISANRNEVQDWRYVDKEELHDLFQMETNMTPWFRKITDKFLYTWWDALIDGRLVDHIDRATIHRM